MSENLLALEKTAHIWCLKCCRLKTPSKTPSHQPLEFTLLGWLIWDKNIKNAVTESSLWGHGVARNGCIPNPKPSAPETSFIRPLERKTLVSRKLSLLREFCVGLNSSSPKMAPHSNSLCLHLSTSPAEDEMVGGLHRLNGHESEQTPGDSEGQGSLVCCSP